LKIAFAGTPLFAASALTAIAAAGFEVSLVLTQPDRPAGRGKAVQQSAVKTLAITLGLPLDQPNSLKDPMSHLALIRAKPDVMVVAAYGLLLPKTVLEIPRYGCLNIHASLLPRWRGAAPIQRAIAAGDCVTGITIMQMDEGLDTGPMISRTEVEITPYETGATLHNKLADTGAQAILDVLKQMKNSFNQGGDSLVMTPQPTNGITYASKLTKSESLIDWQQQAEVIERRIRAFDPVPGNTTQLRARSTLQDSVELNPENNIKIWKTSVVNRDDRSGLPQAPAGAIHISKSKRVMVACSDSWLELLELQRPGGRRISASAWLASHPSLSLGLDSFQSE
jgi:methionyl-tRNA formyltransferase